MEKYRAAYEEMRVNFEKLLRKLSRRYLALQKEAATLGVAVTITEAEFISLWLSSGVAHQIGISPGKYSLFRHDEDGDFTAENIVIRLTTEEPNINRPKQTGLSNKGRVFINDGMVERRIYDHEPIPNGWVKGRISRKRTCRL